MKSFIKILCIAIFSLFLVFQIVSAEETTQNETTVGIRQLMSSANQYPDRIIVQGIVSKVFPQDNLIGLIDYPNTKGCDVKTDKKTFAKSAVKECTMDRTKTCCSKLTLPVQWDGDMPEPETAVRVVGKITHKDGRMLFIGESIQSISNN